MQQQGKYSAACISWDGVMYFTGDQKAGREAKIENIDLLFFQEYKNSDLASLGFRRYIVRIFVHMRKNCTAFRAFNLCIL